MIRRRAVSQPVELLVIPASKDDVFEDIVRVHQSHRPFSRAGQVIVVRHGKNRLSAVARGALGNRRNAVWIDLRGREVLGLTPDETALFTFEEARWWNEFGWAINATSAMPRIAARLAVLSVILGAGGLILGAIALAVTLAG